MHATYTYRRAQVIWRDGWLSSPAPGEGSRFASNSFAKNRRDDMDQVRHEAIRLAVEACAGQPANRIMEFAREIEAYLKGNDKIAKAA